MKLSCLCFVAIAAFLCGCSSESPLVTYNKPLTSPGGEFSRLPPVVQNSVRAEAGAAEISGIMEFENAGLPIYEIRFRSEDVFPPLYVASDGSVLTSNMTVAVGASPGAVEAATGSGVSSLKMDDLPTEVVKTIRHSAPMAEVGSITRLTSDGETVYEIRFKDPAQNPSLLVKDDGKLMR